MIKYAITDPSFFNFSSAKNYFNSLDADFVLYRDKTNSEYAKLAEKFIELAKNRDIKVMLHQDYKLANNLKAYGVHLTSMQFSDIKKAKDLGLFTLISTHSIEEIKKAQALGADAVTFSPIFKTPKKGKPKGIEELKTAVENCNIKVIALGGIVSDKQIELIKKTKAYGFASIRYFKYKI